MNNSYISAIHLAKEVKQGTGKIEILKDINLEILPGEKIAFLGSSGSGKTTLLSILAGLDSDYTGEVRLFGKLLSELNEDERANLRKNRVGFLFQNFLLIPELNVLENVLLPIEIGGKLNSDFEIKAKLLLEKVGLSNRVKAYPNTLSGGEQQRVALARAFINDPEILFVDEPTGSLDELNGSVVTDLLFQLNEKFKTTIILVTHDLDLAKQCDRILQLNSGTLV
ncbi:ABC transporter ATP-binding protein [Polynucleobacter rarus]|jgi:putative ABC transport system ATP-binding protein|uniref:ABC transporter ATP-binding protein n=1 Tax=Polynucleobacter rarus TaxID=556055 RepID=UPI000D3E9C92|nr:ABC transporter ATP-binding protein [Polynucleobacter rarus]